MGELNEATYGATVEMDSELRDLVEDHLSEFGLFDDGEIDRVAGDLQTAIKDGKAKFEPKKLKVKLVKIPGCRQLFVIRTAEPAVLLNFSGALSETKKNHISDTIIGFVQKFTLFPRLDHDDLKLGTDDIQSGHVLALFEAIQKANGYTSDIEIKNF